MTKKTLCLLALTVVVPSLAHGLGIRLPDQDAFATARGEAFAATADRPSAIYYNAAGITQLEGQNFSAGLFSIYVNSEYTAPDGRKFDTKDEIHPVPQLFYTHTLQDLPLAWGLGVYSPYGLSLEWPSNAPFTTLAREGQVNYATFNPVIAWRVHERFSVAAGLTVNYAQADLRRNAYFFAGGAGAAFFPARFKFAGDDIDVGYTAGLLWRPHDVLSFGVSYRSATTMDFEGHSTIRSVLPARARSSAEFDFPQNIVFGVSFRPTPQWNLEFNADWTDWDTLDTVVLKQSGLPSVPLPFNWTSSWFYEWGATRFIGERYSVSAGYIYSENSVPDHSFNPIVPDSDRHIFSLGAGYKGERWHCDLAYQFAWGPSRSVTGSPPSPYPPPFAESADGRYRFLSHAVTLTVGCSF
jgi:long-chain fatty acid transport protein